MMNKKYLLLWFEAPLQSWGSDSKFGRRETLPFPTKSGIYGMFLSSLGAQGAQVELLAQLSVFSQIILSYNPSKITKGGEERKLLYRQPFLMDFQMVGSGYKSDDLWVKMLVPKKSNGSAAVGGGTKMTYRYYLQDARFAVIQELSETLAEDISEALKNPIYDLFLGRKNCVPTDFIYRGVFETQDEAIAGADEIARTKMLLPEFRVIEGEAEGEILSLNDVPVQFGEWKKYRDRVVTVQIL